jgi:hypothetical protein
MAANSVGEHNQQLVADVLGVRLVATQLMGGCTTQASRSSEMQKHL